MVYRNYGGAILAIAAGAILRFAVSGQLSGIALATAGLIVMLAGIAWLVLTLALDFGRRRELHAVPARERVYERELV